MKPIEIDLPDGMLLTEFIFKLQDIHSGIPDAVIREETHFYAHEYSHTTLVITPVSWDEKEKLKIEREERAELARLKEKYE